MFFVILGVCTIEDCISVNIVLGLRELNKMREDKTFTKRDTNRDTNRYTPFSLRKIEGPYCTAQAVRR